VSLTFELSLDERLPDRVVISVCLAPGDGSIQIEGVTVELLSPRQQSLGPRLLLPVSGQLVGPLVTKAELRAHAPLIPPGSVILGTAWTGDEQIEATCAADPWVGLEAHLRGYRVRPPSDRGGTLDDLGEEELGKLAQALPWLRAGGFGPPPSPFLEPEDDEDLAESMDEFVDELGLEDEDAEWLRELMAEDL